jgi:LysR family glycine cleavage system transcriptional activator
MTSDPSLRSLQAFEAAARTGSFVAAASELSVTPAAISQLVRTLEDQIGRKLFHRINRRIVLTESGREILPKLMMAFDELRSVSSELAGTERRSQLIVSVPPSMAAGWLPRRLGEFASAHNFANIWLRAEEDPIPFERDLIDLRLSYGRFHYPGHMTQEIVTDAAYPVCAPSLQRRRDMVAATTDPGTLPLIHTDWGPAAAAFPSWRHWFESQGYDQRHNMQSGITANSSRVSLDLAVAGLGVALGQGIYCADLVRDGLLILPSDRSLALSQPYCITVPQRSVRRSIVASFSEWLANECRLAIAWTADECARER